MSNASKLRTRKPTGRASWPLILLAGEAKTGKTYRACEFTGDERVGRSFVLDLGEGSADEYINVPGALYEIIDHDGTWVDIIAQVEAVRDLAREELAAGNKPVCLIIDSMTAEWAMLTAWTDVRARRSKDNRRLLEQNPDAEINIAPNFWNDANGRHNRLMNVLKTFPGFVIMTALETEKTQMGPGGRPIEGAPKVARPDTQKRVPADATAWIRLSLDREPVVVGMRSLKRNVTPGKDEPEPWKGFTLSELVFDFLGFAEEGAAQVRVAPELNADQVGRGEEVSEEQGTRTRTAEERAGKVKGGVDYILRAGDVDVAGVRQAEIDKSYVAQDVVPLLLLSEQEREELSIGPEQVVTLSQLAEMVCTYVGSNKRAVRRPGPAVDAEAQEVIAQAKADTRALERELAGVR